jgi:hypothetical protein
MRRREKGACSSYELEPGTYRFVWYVSEFADHVESYLSQTNHELSIPQLNDLTIPALITRAFSSEELRAAGPPSPDAIPTEVPHVP